MFKKQALQSGPEIMILAFIEKEMQTLYSWPLNNVGGRGGGQLRVPTFHAVENLCIT